jgi:YggT family protein
MLILQLIDVYSFIILASVVVSWLRLPPSHPVLHWLSVLTEPVLKPVRQVLPSMGGLDFSAIVVLVALSFLRNLFIG